MKWFLVFSLLLNMFLGISIYKFCKANVQVEIVMAVSLPYQFEIIEQNKLLQVRR